MEHDFHPLCTECVHVFFHEVALDATVHHVVIGGFRVPHTETAMMFYRQATELHIGALAHCEQSNWVGLNTSGGQFGSAQS